MIYMFPAYRKAFFIAYNMDSETANYDLFNEILVKHLGLATQNIIKSEQETEINIKNWDGYYVPVLTKVEPFHLLDIIFSHTKVETSKKGALLIPFQGKMSELMYQGNYIFSMRDRVYVSHAFYTATDGNLLITNGISTIKKVDGLKIVAISTSLLLGLAGIVYIVFSGLLLLRKNTLKSINHPLLWMGIPIFTLFISCILIATQSFVRMGDKTMESVLLVTSTVLLPVFSLISLLLILKSKNRLIHNLNFWATIFVIQFCALLMAYGLIPFTLWK